MSSKANILAVAQAKAKKPASSDQSQPAEPVHKTYTFPTPQDDEPTLWPEIRTIIETSIRDNPRNRQVKLGPSELGTDSLHTLAAKLAGWPQVNQQAGWATFVGTCVHAQFEKLFPTLNRTGFDPDDTNVRWETEKKVQVGHLSGLYGGYDISGHIDLYDRKTATTADWKVVSKTTLTLAKSKGPSQQYRIQASLYGLGLANEDLPVERNAIYFLPKSSVSLNDTVPWETDWDPQPAKWALARAQLLVNFMDIIEQADGPEVRDAWISLLPESPTHDFNDGTWGDDGPLSDLNEPNKAIVPDKWKQLIPLLEATYPGEKNE